MAIVLTFREAAVFSPPAEREVSRNVRPQKLEARIGLVCGEVHEGDSSQGFWGLLRGTTLCPAAFSKP
jgi:hypothetical protein